MTLRFFHNISLHRGFIRMSAVL